MKKGGDSRIHNSTSPRRSDFLMEGLEERLLAMEQVPQIVHDFQEGSTKKGTS